VALRTLEAEEDQRHEGQAAGRKQEHSAPQQKLIFIFLWTVGLPVISTITQHSLLLTKFKVVLSSWVLPITIKLLVFLFCLSPPF
jgi:hypothetical protein